MKYLNYFSTFSLLIGFVALLSSCSTSFQAAKYQRYDYVKAPYAAPHDDHSKMGALALKNDPVMNSVPENSETLQPRAINPAVHPITKTQTSTASANGTTSHSHVGVTTSAIQQLQSIIGQNQLNQNGLQKLQQKIQEKASGMSSLDPDLRKAIIFLIIGLILQFFWFIPDVGFVFGIIGAILLVVGLVYLLVYLLNS